MYIQYRMDQAMEVFALTIMVGLLIAAVLEYRGGKKIRGNMIFWMLLHTLVLVLDILNCEMLIRHRNVYMVWCLDELITGLLYLEAFCFACYIAEYLGISGKTKKRFLTIYGLSALGAVAVDVTSPWHGLYYTLEPVSNAVVYSDTFWIAQAVACILLFHNLGLILHYRKRVQKDDLGVLYLYIGIAAVSIVLQYFWDDSLFMLGGTLLILVIYLIIHMRQNTREVMLEKDLIESKLKISMSQIRPHFLYNVLTAIAQLCTQDPEKAKEATLFFAEYLRHNMDSLEGAELLPFDKELEHIHAYLKLEQLRFGDDLKILYDIRTKDFLIPALCLQPLVENAVKWGVGQKEDGGCVRLLTREEQGVVIVCIEDDGVGFDMEKQDDRVHIGIENVRLRLEKLCQASMQIESKKGEGTRVTIRLPRGGGKMNI